MYFVTLDKYETKFDIQESLFTGGLPTSQYLQFIEQRKNNNDTTVE